MARIVPVEEPCGLDAYAAVASLAAQVQAVREEAATLVPALRGRKVWMLNSTPRGGGVAEMLPKLVALLRDLGVDTDWAVIESDEPAFFALTKRIHNMVHGEGEAGLDGADRELFERVAEGNAAQIAKWVRPEDVVVVHDPQPIAVGTRLARALGVPTIWRCHIGLPDRTPVTRDVWRYLQTWAEGYDRAVFSAPDYIPDYLSGNVSVLPPAIDPLSDKNRELPVHALVGVLCNAGLAISFSPVLTPPFANPALRLLPHGEWAPPCEVEEVGLLSRPIVAQISRWDRLKGWAPLLEAFVKLKRRHRPGDGDEHRRRIELLRLVLAGPDPASVADDPEGRGVLEELVRLYRELDAPLQRDVALLTLPMQSRRENALMVNAIQRCASVVVQNSVQEGFGLTVTEAMWKRIPVVGTHACGIRHQIRDRIDGRIVDDGRAPAALADLLDEVLRDRPTRTRLGAAAQRRVYQDFLIFTQLRKWLRLLAEIATDRAPSAPA